MNAESEGWHEPIAEGLWKTDELFGIPRHANWLHTIWALLMIFDDLSWSFWAAGMHAFLIWATAADPEWPAVVSDFFSEPNELEA